MTTAKLLPAGKYTVTSTMLFGRSTKPKGIRRSFTLVGPNELPTTKLRILDVKGLGYVGEAASVRFACATRAREPPWRTCEPR